MAPSEAAPLLPQVEDIIRPVRRRFRPFVFNQFKHGFLKRDETAENRKMPGCRLKFVHDSYCTTYASMIFERDATAFSLSSSVTWV